MRITRKERLLVVLVCTNEKHFLDECLSSLEAQTYRHFDILVLDNNSTDGTSGYITEHYPTVKYINNNYNAGFAKANNQGMTYAFAHGYNLCLLLNPDTVSAKDAVLQLLQTYREGLKVTTKIGLVQPLLLLYDQKDRINSSGNPLHFLGYGYAGNITKPKSIVKSDRRLTSVTGGATLVTKKFFQDTGGFDESFFMYCEDQSMCWQGLLKGYKYFLSHKSLVYHKYRFNRNKLKLYYAERNRLMMLTENYALKTLLLIFPVLLLNEFLIIGYSAATGWLMLKLKSYISYFFHFSKVAKKRRMIQGSRIVSDSTIWGMMESKLDFAPLNNSAMSYVSKFYTFYYKLVTPYV